MNVKLLFLPFTTLVFLWVSIGYTKPTWDKYQTDKKEVKKLVATEAKLQRGLNNINKAYNEYKNLDENTSSYINNALPLVKDNDNLVAEINKNAERAGILVSDISVQKEQSGGNVCQKSNTSNKKQSCNVGSVPIGISLTAIGSYATIKDFVGKLDIENRVIVPKSLQINAEKNTGDQKDENTEKVVSAKVDFNVFYSGKKKNVKLSQAIDTDKVLMSLLSGGLDNGSINKLKKFVTSEVFRPVQADSIGKENLFE